MKKLLTLCAASAALVFAASPAKAQEALDATFGARIGIYIPLEDALNSLDPIWFTLGLDMEFPRRFLVGDTTVVAIDWFTRTGGAAGNAFPVTVNARWYSGDWPRRSYWHVGIGAAFLDFGIAEVVLAARAGIGFEFTERYFGEVNFYITDERRNDVTATGVTGTLGMRF